MLGIYQKVFSLLGARDRKRFFLLLAMVIVMGVFDTVGIASILPFLQVLAEPASVNEPGWLNTLYTVLGFATIKGFSIFLGCMVFVLIVASVTFKALTLYALTRFGAMRTFRISSDLLRGFLNQPYPWFLGRHTSALSNSILNETNQFIAGCLLPALNLLPNLVSTIMIAVFVSYIEPQIALFALLLLGGSYMLIYVALRGLVLRLGERRVAANKARFRAVQEAMGGIKELKLMGLEDMFSARFDASAFRLAQIQSKSLVLQQVPRFALEGLAFGGVILMLLYLVTRGNGDLSQVLPTLGFLVIALGRLLPALQQIYRNFSTMRFSTAVLNNLITELNGLTPPAPEVLAAAKESKRQALTQNLTLQDVSYSYPNAERTALNKLSLDLKANTTIGLVGGTGAGKTTIVDVMLGLLRPDSGQVLVDGTALTPALVPGWQRAIGYVPQQIFLVDASIAENIAFGTKPEDIDPAALERAARVASLHDFITTELPEGYDTKVGEKGTRLSGGQRQRVGIARALYHDPDFLIMDEATSALDNVTERAVMEAVNNISGQKTILMIAHRLTTVRNCDKIILLKHGEKAAEGRYDDLLRDSPDFRAMVEAAGEQ